MRLLAGLWRFLGLVGGLVPAVLFLCACASAGGVYHAEYPIQYRVVDGWELDRYCGNRSFRDADKGCYRVADGICYVYMLSLLSERDMQETREHEEEHCRRGDFH